MGVLIVYYNFIIVDYDSAPYYVDIGQRFANGVIDVVLKGSYHDNQSLKAFTGYRNFKIGFDNIVFL